MYNLLGSHDTERILTALNSDIKKVKLAQDILFTLPGTPAIYYGDEIGLTGGKDPDCRKAFNWKQEEWNQGLFENVRENIKTRLTQEVLRTGTLEIVKTDGDQSIAVFVRKTDKKSILVAVNPTVSQKKAKINLIENKMGHVKRAISIKQKSVFQANEHLLGSYCPTDER